MWKLTRLSSLRDEKPSLSSSEEKSSEFGQQENENEREGKNRARLCIFYIFIYLYLLQWMQENIYRDVFPTFLTKKSYGQWITRRRIEIYTKISEEKYPKVSVANVGKLQEKFQSTMQNGCEVISQQNGDFAAVQHSAFSLE